jgi:DNA-binding NarL/FixJ family response regulator
MHILIADNWLNVQSGLRLLLEQQQGLEVVGQVADTDELLARIEHDCPDMVLLGWELPGLRGADLLPALRSVCPDLFVVVLSGRADARRAALAAGADVFVSKIDPPERLLSAILGRRQGESGTGHRHEDRLRGHRQRSARTASVECDPGEDESCRRASYIVTGRRSTMVEVEKKRKDTLRHVAVIAVAAVMLGCIAAGLTVSLVLISEIPFYHIFPR